MDELDFVDKLDILALVQVQRDKQYERLRINGCIAAQIVLRRKLKKRFRDATKNNIHILLEGMERKIF